MTPDRYRSKVVEIEAMALTLANVEAVAAWCGGIVQRDTKPSDPTDVAIWLNIPTLEGVMRGNLGDYVIHGTADEFYPCKPHVFVAKYEAVTA